MCIILVHVLLSSTVLQFGEFNRVISEHDGSSMVCVIFMDESSVTVEGELTTANSTAIGIAF